MLLSDLTTAFMLLTRLPVPRPGRAPDMARCVWAFPIVGLAVNLAGGAVYGIGHRLGMPPLLAAAWTVAAVLMMTGAFHEDGLADTADGFGGGPTKARKLEIMRDSRIGSYGALALLLSVAVRVAALSALGRSLPVTGAMVVAGMLGRSGMLIPLLMLPPARGDGMGASMGRPGTGSAAVALALSAGAAFTLLPAGPALGAVVLGAAAPGAFAMLAARHIGGYTGDVLGAAEVVTECVVLSGLVCFLGA